MAVPPHLLVLGQPVCAACNSSQPPNSKKWILMPFYIKCMSCARTFHLPCSTLEGYEAIHFSHFACMGCAGTWTYFNPIPILAPHRFDWWLKNNTSSTQIGSMTWTVQNIQNTTLDRIPFAISDNQFSVVEDGFALFKKVAAVGGIHQWNFVTLIKCTKGFNTKWRTGDWTTIPHFVNFYGPGRLVIVTDVFSDRRVTKKIGTLLALLHANAALPQIWRFNADPFDISRHPGLHEYAAPPSFIKKISIVDMVWNEKSPRWIGSGKTFVPEDNKPCMEQRLFLDMKDTYRKVLISPSGSTTMIYLITGAQRYYMAPPNDHNLLAYENFCLTSPNANCLLLDQLQNVKKVDLQTGQTLIIPSGWLFAVWSNTVTFGIHSIYLQLGQLESQIKIYDLELSINSRRNNLIRLFPHFESIYWMYTKHVVIPTLQNANAKHENVTYKHLYMWNDLELLVRKLTLWRRNEKNNPTKDEKDVKEMKSIVKLLKNEIIEQEKY